MDAISRNAPVQSYQLTASGGTSNATYFLCRRLSGSAGHRGLYTYSRTFNQHRLTVLAGTEAEHYNSRSLNGSRSDYYLLGNLDYYYLNPGTSNITNGSSGSESALFSYFGRADYAFKDKYLLSATLRGDGSSRFSPSNQYAYFPGVAAWRLSGEPFLKSVHWINDLKLRVGYGITGNQRIPDFQYLARIQSSLTGTSYALGGGNALTTGVWQNSYDNPDVKWESTSSTNIGLDSTLLNGAVDGGIDWYSRRTTGMLYPVPLPSSSVGQGASPYQNVGKMSNKGIELQLGYHYNQAGDANSFKFDIGVNFSTYRNKIVSLSNTLNQQPYGNL